MTLYKNLGQVDIKKWAHFYKIKYSKIMLKGNCNHRLENSHLQTGCLQMGRFEMPRFLCSELQRLD